MQASVLRAVENRVYVVRSANTGISCIIDDAAESYPASKMIRVRDVYHGVYFRHNILKQDERVFIPALVISFSVACGLFAAFLLLGLRWWRPKLAKPAISILLVCFSLASYIVSPAYAALSQDQAKNCLLGITAES